jgi:branched-chain amino acid transport system ATP-binding protein
MSNRRTSVSDVLRLDGIEASFGRMQVLRGLDFGVGEGEVVALLGPNGSGKSTTVRTIAGLVKASGSVFYRGEDISRLSVRRRVRAGVKLVPQGRNLFGSMTVEENLLMGAFSRSDNDEIAADLEHWLGFFPVVGERRHQRASQLSGGQRQMVAVATGLMARPSVMLLDEPSLGVAPKVLDDLTAALRRLREELGLSVVLVEQDVPFALDVADRVLVLAAGRIALEGVPAELRDGDRLRDVYFYGNGTSKGET